MIGYTQGRFDVLHYGHVISLLNMKDYLGDGSKLIVGVAEDDFCKEWKTEVPLLNWQSRSFVLRHLDCVDVVVSYNEVYPLNVYNKLKFDIFFCTDELYQTEIGDKLLEYPFKTVFLPRTPDISSTKIKNNGK